MSNSIYNLVHATSREHIRDAQSTATIYLIDTKTRTISSTIYTVSNELRFDGIDKSPIIRKFVPKRKKKGEEDTMEKKRKRRISVIYKPHPPLSTTLEVPPRSRGERGGEKKASWAISRVSSRIGRGWTIYKFRTPGHVRRGESEHRFRKHRQAAEKGGSYRVGGWEGLEGWRKGMKGGCREPSRRSRDGVSTPNWTEAGNKYYVSFVGPVL